MVQLTLGAAYTHKWAYGLGLSCFLLICRGLTVPVKVPVKDPCMEMPVLHTYQFQASRAALLALPNTGRKRSTWDCQHPGALCASNIMVLQHFSQISALLRSY